ncbi:aspartate aminotransferase family protein [Andreprevotia chitinilytica]|uniref:aspartate aminotransferase family protein n=1 Tax=Andreprevotia chitinilytica TaxID=396808 RepID=UPI00054EC738|nr:aspartate aminotransferase family protein [Andreprevotia chitinilytica]
MNPIQVSRATFDEVMVPLFAPSPMIPAKALGSHIWDTNGKQYIDLSGGIAVTALGHSHPELLKVFHAQGDAIWHVSNGFTNEPALRLATKLVDATFADKVFFANSGAEANEAALKLARRVAFDRAGKDKDEIISCLQSFHGRTLFTVSVGGQPKYAEGFGPLPGGISHIPYNDIDAARAAISDRTCAVIVEPIQGEGGVIPARREYLQVLRELCDQHGALLIFDEVQTGVGRSGSLYAYMEYGVTPDILTTAKALGNGFPVGAMLTTAEIAKHFSVGTHGTTYGGNPLAAAIAEKVIDIVSDPVVLAGVRQKHDRFVAGLKRINDKYGVFKDIRGVGLLLGAEVSDAFKGKAKEFTTLGIKHGVLTLIAGPSVVRFAPSLLIPDADIDEGLARFEKAVAEMVATVAATA